MLANLAQGTSIQRASYAVSNQQVYAALVAMEVLVALAIRPTRGERARLKQKKELARSEKRQAAKIKEDRTRRAYTKAQSLHLPQKSPARESTGIPVTANQEKSAIRNSSTIFGLPAATLIIASGFFPRRGTGLR